MVPSPPSHPTPAAGQLVREISPGVTKGTSVFIQDLVRSHLSLGDPNLYEKKKDKQFVSSIYLLLFHLMSKTSILHLPGPNYPFLLLV